MAKHVYIIIPMCRALHSARLGVSGAKDFPMAFIVPGSIKRIGPERFDSMLNILPPAHWCGVGCFAESFKLCELNYGDITTVFCRLGAAHFELKADIHTPHTQVVAHCSAFQKVTRGVCSDGR